MGDPLTMAMIGAGVGAVTNPRKPLQGALLGGALGGFGGAAMGGFKAAGSAGTSGLAGGGGSGMFTAGTQVANPMATGTYFTAGTPAAAGSLQAGGNAVMNVGQTAIGTSPTFMEQMKGGLQGIGQFNRENPMVGQVGFNAFNNLMQPLPVTTTAPGLLRGTPAQEQPMQYALPMPQVSLI